MTRREIESRILAWIDEGPLADADDARFEELACEVFTLQYAHNAPYQRMCDAFGRDPARVDHWTEIPAVPTGTFKEARLACFPKSETTLTFRTSGSTSGKRGEMHLDRLELYRASILATFGHYVCQNRNMRFLVLAPSALDAPDSSLSFMFATALDRFGSESSSFLVGADGWEPEKAIKILAAAREPVALVGTAFAFVHLIDALEDRGSLNLPEGSVVMETGGFKGRSRSVPREELHAAIETRLDIPRTRVINQYGMSEMLSQFYEPTLELGRSTTLKCTPPWVRTRVVDPSSFIDCAPGEQGILVHYDLANAAQVLAIQTSDAGVIRDGGFEVLGRVEGAEERGCSIAADLLLAQE